MAPSKKTEKMRSMYDRCWHLHNAALHERPGMQSHDGRNTERSSETHNPLQHPMRFQECRYKEEEAGKQESLAAKYLQPLDRNPRAAKLSPQEDLKRYQLHILKGQLSPKFHKAAKQCAAAMSVCMRAGLCQNDCNSALCKTAWLHAS